MRTLRWRAHLGGSGKTVVYEVVQFDNIDEALQNVDVERLLKDINYMNRLHAIAAARRDEPRNRK